MRMELACRADDAARIARLPIIAASRQGRPASRTCRITWHDGETRELVGAGLILAEARDGWAIERIHPRDAAWLPGAPAPVIAHAADRDGHADRLPAGTAALARFDGRDTTHTLTVEGAPATLTIRRGMLRAGPAERPACRILLDGEEAAVLHLALALSQALPLTLPRASLAAEAVALSQDAADPPARRLGTPVLPADTEDTATVTGAFRHTLGHLTDVVLHFAPLVLDGRHGTEPVHQMRVAVRRARSAITLFRGGVAHPRLDRAAAGLKVLGGRLGPSRDWDVFCTETALPVRACFPDERRLHRLLAAAEARRQECHAALREYLLGPAFRLLCIELAWLSASAGWTGGPDHPAPSAEGMAQFVAAVMQRRQRRLRSAGKGIGKLDIPALHDLRLRAKRARYAAEVFVPLYPGKASERFIRRLSRLQQELGVLNDGAVAAGLLGELGGPAGRHGYAIGLVQGFMAARAAMVRPAILGAWEKFRRVAPFWT